MGECVVGSASRLLKYLFQQPAKAGHSCPAGKSITQVIDFRIPSPGVYRTWYGWKTHGWGFSASC